MPTQWPAPSRPMSIMASRETPEASLIPFVPSKLAIRLCVGTRGFGQLGVKGQVVVLKNALPLTFHIIVLSRIHRPDQQGAGTQQDKKGGRNEKIHAFHINAPCHWPVLLRRAWHHCGRPYAQGAPGAGH